MITHCSQSTLSLPISNKENCFLSAANLCEVLLLKAALSLAKCFAGTHTAVSVAVLALASFGDAAHIRLLLFE